jgi:hypothetical protein
MREDGAGTVLEQGVVPAEDGPAVAVQVWVAEEQDVVAVSAARD